MQIIRWLTAGAMAVVALPALGFGGAVFRVTVDPGVRHDPCTGRLVIYLIREQSRQGVGSEPADGPFFEDPQPMFGMDVTHLKPGAPVTIDDSATSFPVKPSELKSGKYLAQAVLDMHQDDSQWKR